MHRSLVFSLLASVLLLGSVASAQQVELTGTLFNDGGDSRYPSHLIAPDGTRYALSDVQGPIYRLFTLTERLTGIEGRRVTLRGELRVADGAPSLALRAVVDPKPDEVELEVVVTGAASVRIGDHTVEAFGPAASALALSSTWGRKIKVRAVVFQAAGEAPRSVYLRAVQGVSHGARLRDPSGGVVGLLWPGTRVWINTVTDAGAEVEGGTVRRKIRTSAIGLPYLQRPKTVARVSRLGFGKPVLAAVATEIAEEGAPTADTGGIAGGLRQ